MNAVTIVVAYLDRKPMGGSPLANALRARGHRITDDVCVLENVIYCRTEKGLRAQYLTDARAIAAVSGVPGALATNIWYEFDTNLTIEINLSEIELPKHDFLIRNIELDYCLYRLDKDKIYLSAISNGACGMIESAARANGFTPIYIKNFEPIFTGTCERYPGLVWALESILSEPLTDLSKGNFEGIAASYCALTGAKISVDYFDKSFIIKTTTSEINHKCFRRVPGEF